MRTSSLAAAIAAGALLAGCSKPEPAGGAPSPNVVTADSTKPTDSTAAAMPDSTNAVKDTAAPATPDTTKRTEAMSARHLTAPGSPASPTSPRFAR